MLLYYIRHGDPIYEPDSLTKLGERQAEAVGRRLALHGIDRIYASTSNRAVCTAEPLAEIMKKDIVQLDFASEQYTWNEFVVMRNGQKRWIFQDEQMRMLFQQPEIRSLGDKWYEHPDLLPYGYERGVRRVYQESDRFLAELGYEHQDYTGRYRVLKDHQERIALFAHQGFGLAFLSCILDIPYPQFTTHFDMCHTGITVIDFHEENGFAIPRVCMMSSDDHIYKEGLPTRYNQEFYI